MAPFSQNGRAHMQEIMETIGLSAKANVPAGILAHGEKQWLELGMLMAQDPELLLVEPSGVAEISEILQVFSDPSLEGVIRLDAVITVLDAETFLEFSEPEAFSALSITSIDTVIFLAVSFNPSWSCKAAITATRNGSRGSSPGNALAPGARPPASCTACV
jgi:hypothetical protein